MSMIVLFFLIIISTYVFELRILRQYSQFDYIRFFILSGVVIISLPYVFRFKGGFVCPVWLISFSILFSIYMSWHSWDQSFIDGFKITVQYLSWFFFFYLLHKSPSFLKIEKLILILGFLYIILYFYQLFSFPVKIFGYDSAVMNTRGAIRVLLPGDGVFILLTFLALNKYTDSINNKKFWLFITLICLLITILQVTRQNIFAIFLIFIFHLLRTQSAKTKIIAVVFVVGAFIFFSYSNLEMIRGIREVQEDTQKQGQKYIRFVAAEYFLTDFSPNNRSRVFGNGMPYGDKNAYGRFVITKLQSKKLFFYTDVGIIAVYALFGIFAVIGYIIIFIKSFTVPLPPEYLYLKYYIWFLMITMFTSHNLFHYYFIFTTIIVLYMYHRINELTNLSTRAVTGKTEETDSGTFKSI
jgi:hypothetical protein